jgi:hypothetical protein
VDSPLADEALDGRILGWFKSGAPPGSRYAAGLSFQPHRSS